MRLLEAFYDLSEEKLNEPVPLGEPGDEREGAVTRAGLDPRSTETDVAVKYLLDQGYIEAADETSATYRITVPGLDRVRQMREASRG